MQEPCPPGGSLSSWPALKLASGNTGLHAAGPTCPGDPTPRSRAGSSEEGSQRPDSEEQRSADWSCWSPEVLTRVSGLAPDPTSPAPSPREPGCPRTISSVETGNHVTGREPSSSYCPLSRRAPKTDLLCPHPICSGKVGLCPQLSGNPPHPQCLPGRHLSIYLPSQSLQGSVTSGLCPTGLPPSPTKAVLPPGQPPWSP